MSNRFHNKFHRHNHHTYPVAGEPDSGYDPIASQQDPFQGDFVLNGQLSATATLSAAAGIFSSNNLALSAVSNNGTAIFASASSKNIGDIDIDKFGNSSIIFPDWTAPALDADGNILSHYALSAESIWTNNLYAASSILVVTDMHMSELSGFTVLGTDYNTAVPVSIDPATQQVVLMRGIGVSGTSWASFGGDLQTHNDLYVDNNALISNSLAVEGNTYLSGTLIVDDSITTNSNLYVSGVAFIGAGLDLGCSSLTNVSTISTTCVPTISVHNNLDLMNHSISGIANDSLTFVSEAKIQSDNDKRIKLDSYSYAESISTGTSAFGENSHAEGVNTKAEGTGSHTEGLTTSATNEYAHAEGWDSIASGYTSHAEGRNGNALGEYSHAEGRETYAIANVSHTEGYLTSAMGYAAHAECAYNTASGNYSHAEGYNTIASGEGSHAQGNTQSLSADIIAEGPGSFAGGYIPDAGIHTTIASGSGSFAFGQGVSAIGDYSVAFGGENKALGYGAVAFGALNISDGIYTSTEGYGNSAFDPASHAEGVGNIANGQGAHAEGENTTASSEGAHSEGYGTSAGFSASHAEGYNTSTQGNNSHAEGQNTVAGNGIRNTGAHAEGIGTKALGAGSHSQGCTQSLSADIIAQGIGSFAGGFLDEYATNTTIAAGSGSFAMGYGVSAIGDYSHAEGYTTTASGDQSHAEGISTTASASGSHAEGSNTFAIGDYSHAEGATTRAHGNYSHAEGSTTSAIGNYSHAEGLFGTAAGSRAHVENYANAAIGNESHAEGINNRVFGYASHGEGDSNIVGGNYSHIAGKDNTIYSHSSFIGSGENNNCVGYTILSADSVSFATPVNTLTFSGNVTGNVTYPGVNGCIMYLEHSSNLSERIARMYYTSVTYNSGPDTTTIGVSGVYYNENIIDLSFPGNSDIRIVDYDKNNYDAYTSIIGGSNNTAQGINSVIVGGYNNDILDSDYSFIGGGSAHEISGSNNSFIGGGGGNYILNSVRSIIVGGYQNYIINDNIPNPTQYATIVGGSGNSVSASYGGIFSGASNEIGGSQGSFIGAGTNNKIGIQDTDAGHSFIGAGWRNTVEGSGSGILAGAYNTVDGLHSSIPGGLYNTVSADNSFAAGVCAQVMHDNTFLFATSGFTTPVYSTNSEQFMVSAANGVVLGETVNVQGGIIIDSPYIPATFEFGGFATKYNSCIVATQNNNQYDYGLIIKSVEMPIDMYGMWITEDNNNIPTFVLSHQLSGDGSADGYTGVFTVTPSGVLISPTSTTSTQSISGLVETNALIVDENMTIFGDLSIDNKATINSDANGNLNLFPETSAAVINLSGDVVSGNLSAVELHGDGSNLTGVGGGTVQGTDGTYDIEATLEGATAGNARGENSVDLCTKRSNAAYVPSGICSMNAAGENNGGTGTHSLISGKANYSNLGNYCSISGSGNSSNTGDNCLITGDGASGNILDLARVHGGDSNARIIDLVAQINSSGTAATELLLGGAGGTRIIISDQSAWNVDVRFVAKTATGANAAIQNFTGLIVRDGASTTYAAGTSDAAITEIGTSNAAFTVAADDTNEALKLTVAASSGVLRASARIQLTQVDY